MKLHQTYLYDSFVNYPMIQIAIILLSTFTFSSEMDTEKTIIDSLPHNMPSIKKIFWGNDGVIRNSFMNPKSRMKELKIRRNMLQLHQRIALLNLGCMVYQYNIGKTMKEDSSQYMDLKDAHMSLGYTSFGLYMTAAGLSILAPPGMKYSNKKFSSNKIHRYLALIHFTGMALQPYLGYKTAVARIEGDNNYDKLMDTHEIVGGITLSTYFLAFLTTLFK